MGRVRALAARVVRSRRLRIGLAAFLVFYVVSYGVLSRWGSAVASRYGAGGSFLYVPCEWEQYDKHPSLQVVHYALVAFYWPVWCLDYYVLGGPHWSHVPMFHIDFGDAYEKVPGTP